MFYGLILSDYLRTIKGEEDRCWSQIGACRMWALYDIDLANSYVKTAVESGSTLEACERLDTAFKPEQGYFYDFRTNRFPHMPKDIDFEGRDPDNDLLCKLAWKWFYDNVETAIMVGHLTVPGAYPRTIARVTMMTDWAHWDPSSLDRVYGQIISPGVSMAGDFPYFELVEVANI